MRLSKLLTATLVTLPLCACAATPLETVFAPIDSAGWKVAHAADVPGQGTIVERIPEGETLQTWSRMLTVQFLEGEQRTPAEVMAMLEERMQERGGTLEWSVIHAEPLSVLYEWRLTEHPVHGDQNELARLLQGNDGIHRLAFAWKGAPLSAEERARWIADFEAAFVVKGERHERVEVGAD